MNEDGGGASRTTDPAAGTSTATDVSLREFVAMQFSFLDRRISAEINALRRETEAANMNSDKAIEVAAAEASDRLAAHNGLIEQMRNQALEFARRETLEDFKRERHNVLDAFKDETDKRFGRIERFQATLVGGLLLVSFIGVANLIKVWASG